MAQAAPVASLSTPIRFRHTLWWYFKWLFIFLSLIMFCATIAASVVLQQISDDLSHISPDIHLLMVSNKAEPTRVFAADGSLLAEFKGEERKWVPIEELKSNPDKGYPTRRLVEATLSIEDKRFYQHEGVDPTRIAGALLANLRHHDISQGGSTITEQLVKNVYLTQTKTMNRRLNTALIALQLERRLSKDEILEAYLNAIYYGNGAYGCEAAAQRYFGKHARDLDIPEAALVAGLPQSPTRMDPFAHIKHALARQKVVLKEMFLNKLITWAEWKAAINDQAMMEELQQGRRHYARDQRRMERWRYPYFVSYVRQYLQRQYGWSDTYLDKSGLKIYTTLDPQIQDVAEQTLYQHVDGLRRPGLQGALVCIDPWSGRIVAMVGGRNYYGDGGQWNRAVQAKRQVGSTMKPYVYATAMEEGLTPDTVIRDSPLYVCGYSECGTGSDTRDKVEIRNYDRRHYGNLTLRKAIGMSNNVVSTRLLLKVGIQNVVDKAHLMGITSVLHPVASLALGTSELSLLEHVSAYGVFATRGLHADSTPVTRVDNGSGETLVEQPVPARGARVLSDPAANYMWDMLHYVVTNGTGRAANIPGQNVIGKTGTTSSNKDVWFMGATDDLVTGVWMGYDQPRELYGSAGGRWCAPVWHDFMKRSLDIWHARNPVKSLIEDARATAQQKLLADQYKNSVKLKICNDSGLLATQYCPNTHITEFPSAGVAPTQYCDIPEHQHPQAPDNSPGAPPVARTSTDAGDGTTDASAGPYAAGAGDGGRQAVPGPVATAPAAGGVMELDPSTNSGRVLDEATPLPDNFAPPPAGAAAAPVDPNALARRAGA